MSQTVAPIPCNPSPPFFVPGDQLVFLYPVIIKERRRKETLSRTTAKRAAHAK